MEKEIFEFESIEFTTQSVMNKEKGRLVDELCDYIGVERKDFRLQQGNIVIHGLTSEGNWFPLTSRISEFSDKIREKGYISYKLKSKLQIEKKF